MILTLYRYILRDFSRAFGLCWVALTLIVTLTNGVIQYFRVDGLNAVELAQVFLLFVPVAATVVVPVAALFGAAIAFGRMSADNEITACRAAGLDVHRLLRPALLIAIGVAALNYYGFNHLIPRFYRAGEAITQRDFPKLVASTLRNHRAGVLGDMALHPERVGELKVDPHNPHIQYLELGRVVFLKRDDRDYGAFGTAERAVITFDMTGQPSASATLYKLRWYDNKEYGEQDAFSLPPQTREIRPKDKLTYVDLTSLRAFQRDPMLIGEVAAAVRKLRNAMTATLTYEAVADALQRGQSFRLQRGTDSVVLRAAVSGRDSIHGDIGLAAPKAEVAADGQVTQYDAATGEVLIELAKDTNTLFVRITLRDLSADVGPRRPKQELPPMDIPVGVQEQMTALSDEELVYPRGPLPDNPTVLQARALVEKLLDRKVAQIDSLIHFRSAWAVSALPLVLLAAMLGIRFRGGQVLTAFGVSCIPAFIVFLVLLLGRNQASDPHGSLHSHGLAMMWGIDALASLLAVIAAYRIVDR